MTSLGEIPMIKRLFVLLAVMIVFAGCGKETEQVEVEEVRTAKPLEALTINWQRMVDEEGETCERCGATAAEVEKAHQMLKRTLASSGIAVALSLKELSPAVCAQDVSQSNRIWIGERALEEWLGAEVGDSPCASCCGTVGSDVKCRTLIYEGQTYEAVPADLIVKAGLLAASDLFGVDVSWGASTAATGRHPGRCSGECSAECKGHGGVCGQACPGSSAGCQGQKSTCDPQCPAIGDACKVGKGSCCPRSATN